MSSKRPDPQSTLERLKVFQRHSVDYVFRRLYEDVDCVDRFLLADEVGLGKTLVARGVIARAVDRLWGVVPRIDVVYICSNGDIARQNINRLKLEGQNEFTFASRLTLLPLHAGDLESRKLNFVSFTPGTSFDLGSRSGVMEERALLYHLLKAPWDLHGAGPMNVLQGTASTDGWRNYLRWFRDESYHKIDKGLAAAFVSEVNRENRLRERFVNLCGRFQRERKYVPWDDRADRNELVGELRRLLAHCCIKRLEPDLIILDEFQRFRHLLHGTDEVAQLARELFNHEGAKTLLLSATPYKMYTMAHDAAEEDHYSDFIQTTRFLLSSNDEVAEFEKELRAYRAAMCLKERDNVRLLQAKAAVEHRLRRVMCRTERLGVSADRNGMLIEATTRAAPFEYRDAAAYGAIDAVASSLGAMDSMELWKSGPYLLNFMEDYDLKRKLRSAVGQNSPSVKAALRNAAEALFSSQAVDRYEPVDAGNARLRSLISSSVECGGWRLLWLPPSLPYYSPRGVYEQVAGGGFTKALVFSSWQLVPKVIAILGSYEAERRMVRLGDPSVRHGELHERQGPLLRFSVDNERLTGLSVFTLLYPCVTLAREIDPLVIARRISNGGGIPTAEAVLAEATKSADILLQQVMAETRPVGGSVDERWYWAALLLLDRFRLVPVRNWIESTDENAWRWMAGEDDTAFSRHVDETLRFFEPRTGLGLPPKDLATVIAKVALASPAVVALRALGRRWPKAHAAPALLSAAAKVAMGFRTLFNLPETTLMLRGLNPLEPYWERALDYGIDGNLQAVTDEYVHVLIESMGLESGAAEVALEVAEMFHAAVALRTTTLAYDEVLLDDANQVSLRQHRMRCRYSLRFGEGDNEDGSEVTREDQVRSAFNSPFRPFILASTSVGQEGLDFHPYCHAIYHWNLPTNPVDLEQREGRIHRYKGHVIRKNLSARYGLSVTVNAADPWDALFAQATSDRPAKTSDLVPFWVFNGPWKIERHVPIFPLSRDVSRYEDLKRSLTLYRLVFGQPRQEDLLSYLKSRAGAESTMEDLLAYRIDLSPPTESQPHFTRETP